MYSIPKPKMVKLTLSRSPPGSFRNLLKDIRAKRVFDYQILRLKAVQQVEPENDFKWKQNWVDFMEVDSMVVHLHF